VRGFCRAVFVLEDGALHVERPGTGKVDCHLLVDPVTNFLMAWGRITPLRATAKGRLIAWGRRPWRALQLTQVIRTP
jgi:hypothetical protein